MISRRILSVQTGHSFEGKDTFLLDKELWWVEREVKDKWHEEVP